MREVKFQDAHVRLSGEGGNSFAIIARARSALKSAKATEAEIEEFTEIATSGNYDNVLQTVMAWCRTS